MSTEPQLRLWMGSGDQTDDTNVHYFTQDPSKKTAFLLDLDVERRIDNPAHLIVEYRSASSRNIPFFLGGFQIIANAKSVEVYLTEEKTGMEGYLMTSKGILFEKGEIVGERLKAMCVVPGGPRAVTRLHLKLLSLQPKGETSALLASLRLTARLPEIESVRLEAATLDSKPPPTVSQHSNHVASHQNAAKTATSHADTAIAEGSIGSPAITQADIGIAMSSMSFMARTTEENMTRAMIAQFTKLEHYLEARWTKMEQNVDFLTSVVVSQKTDLEEKLKLIEQQQDIINLQGEQMNRLLEQQQELTESVKAMQLEMRGIL